MTKLTDEEHKGMSYLKAMGPTSIREDYLLGIIDRLTTPPTVEPDTRLTNTCDDDTHPQCIAQGEACLKHTTAEQPGEITDDEAQRINDTLGWNDSLGTIKTIKQACNAFLKIRRLRAGTP